MTSYENFLQAVFCINGKSFNDLESYERMPLRKIYTLIAVYTNAVEAERAAYEKAKKKK